MSGANDDKIVEMEHVFVARDGETVLHDISLVIERGEHLVLLGPNGCGKSTLLKTLTCELYPLPKPKTQIRIFGRQRWDVSELRRRMGVVSAELPGKPMLSTTGFDAILTGFFSSSTLWPNLVVTPAMRERTEAILEQVNATALRHRLVGSLSAGQQRRLMIGRAMAGTTGEVQILLLDEPTNALDLAAQYDLRQTLAGLAQDGTAILLVTHQVSDILPEISRVLMMSGGRIVADGLKSNLLNSSVLSELFGRHVHVEMQNGLYFAR